jgi:hypothetical protein
MDIVVLNANAFSGLWALAPAHPRCFRSLPAATSSQLCVAARPSLLRSGSLVHLSIYVQ